MHKAYSRIDPLTPRIVVLKFFVCGGKVNLKEAIQRTGLTSKDLFGFVSHRGMSYHRLMEKCIEETGVDVNEFQSDFYNEIDEIISGGKAAAFDELRPYIEVKPRIHPTITALNEKLEQAREEEYQKKLYKHPSQWRLKL